MPSILLVDYENVTMSGLTGYEKLSGKDKIYIFFSANNLNIDADFLAKCKCQVKYYKVPQGDESVDKHILAFLGYQAAVNDNSFDYLILSKDKGFDNIASFMKELTSKNIKRYVSISDALNSKEQKKTAKAKTQAKENEPRKQKHLFSEIESIVRKACKEPEVDTVVDIVLKNYEKKTFKNIINTQLVKKFGQERGHILYKSIKSLL